MYLVGFEAVEHVLEAPRVVSLLVDLPLDLRGVAVQALDPH